MKSSVQKYSFLVIFMKGALPLKQGGGHKEGLKGPGPSLQKQVHFQQMHNKGLRQLFLTVSWDLSAKQATPDSVLVSL